MSSRFPRRVTDINDLIALAPGSVVLDHAGDAWQLNSAGGERWWTGARNSEPWTTAELFFTFSTYSALLVVFDSTATAPDLDGWQPYAAPRLGGE